ncbi:uncharacterized protein LOC105161014 isoform X3 [Sesamum indicum]|uniref:Uncharacterized protein LOC105161014 isoform X3 n=1 Tax=Sesamum indicum TaxID=4182 RepID=A0A6I9T1X5_SESIN|nr:uncharacterized protein LOC105161014 isoform X3 [Sesamum indicum]
MSKQAQLPPRCPIQKKTMGCQATVPVSSPSCKDTELHARKSGHCESFWQSFILEEQPAWLNDLLSDTDSNWNDSCEPDDGLGSGCTYGPNSPRRKNKWSLPEKEIVSAFSEYVMQNPLQHVDGYISVPGESDSNGDAYTSASEINTGNKAMKRHPGQRSRARKLQYITDLERTVDILQNLGSELAVRVASISQQNAALSMENNTLKQQLLRMQREKFIVDSEFQSLKKEVVRLKTSLTVSANNNNVYNRSSFTANLAHSDAMWDMLDMRKLDLN